MENNNFESRLTSLERRIKELEEGSQGVIRSGTVSKSQERMSINEFLKKKKLDDDVKRTLAVAYYLDYFEKLDSFNSDDIKKWFRLARFAIPKNINDKVNMNINNAHIAEQKEKKDSKKAWYVTNTGAEFVENELNK